MRYLNAGSMRSILERLPYIGPKLISVATVAARRRFSSAAYWERRYQDGGTSGAGSYGALAAFKADVLNAFVRSQGINSVVEFGCGDGNQLSLAQYPRYLGYDISPAAIERCRKRFAQDPTKEFAIYDSRTFDPFRQAELAMSIDVIYHLTEDAVFDVYMRHLFEAATRFVIIYSDDVDDTVLSADSIHVRHRKFSKWICANAPAWRCIERIPNRYPKQGPDGDGSWCDFWIYEAPAAVSKS